MRRDHMRVLMRARLRAYLLLTVGAILLCSASFCLRTWVMADLADSRIQNAQLLAEHQAQQPQLKFAIQFQEMQALQKNNRMVLDGLYALEDFKSSGVSFRKIVFSDGKLLVQSGTRKQHFRQKERLECWQQESHELITFVYIC